MNGHASEDALIRVLFDLASDEERAAVQAHLETCAACRVLRDRLAARFRSLDELDEPVQVSEALIAQAAAPGLRPHQGRSRRWWVAWPTWAGAVAAVLVLGVLVTQSYRNHRDRDGIVLWDRAPAELAEKLSTVAGQDSIMDSAALAKADAAIEEVPPFAPASAIELNVLPRRDTLQLTIYNAADLTLVRETRELTFKRGWNWLQLMWANTLIDPTSLSLEPLEHADKIEVQQLVYPPRLKDLGRWLIRSEVSGQVPVRITYMTSGLSWRAFYMGTLTPDEKQMHLAGYVRVDNQSGEDYENAQVRLVVGRVHLLDQIADLARRPQPYGSPIPDELHSLRRAGDWALWFDNGDQTQDKLLLGMEFRNGHGMMGGMGGMGGFGGGLPVPKEIAKEGLSEYFLYTIEGTETIPTGWSKRLPSFDVDGIAVESLYKYDERRWGPNAVRYVSFANDDEHELGETPIPDGTVRVYRENVDGHLSYIGGTTIKYIPVDEDIELNLGPDSQVKVEPVLMETRTDNYRFDTRGNISGWDEVQTWKVTITNTRELPVRMEIFRHFGTPYWTIVNRGDFGDYAPDDAMTGKYVLQVEPRSKREFEYVLTTYYGKRQEEYSRR